MNGWMYVAAALVGVAVTWPLVVWRIVRAVTHEGVGYVPSFAP